MLGALFWSIDNPLTQRSICTESVPVMLEKKWICCSGKDSKAIVFHNNVPQKCKFGYDMIGNLASVLWAA